MAVTSFLGLLGTIFSGGATGILGGAIQSVFIWLNKKQELQGKELDHKFQIDLIRANSEVMKEEYAQRVSLTRAEYEGRTNVADAEAFAKGFEAEAANGLLSQKVAPTVGQGWLLILADVVKGVIRPGLTLYLCGIATMMYLEARTLLELHGLKDLPIQSAIEIHNKLSDTLLYLFSTCVAWWFYARFTGIKK